MRQHICIMLTLLSGLAVATPGGAASVDRLKPAYHEKQEDLKRLLERLSQGGLEYEITVEHKVWETTFMGRARGETYIHRLKLPKEIEERLERFDWPFIRANFLQYLNDPKFSFYAALLLMDRIQSAGEHQFGEGFDCPLRLEPLEKHDKALWDSDLTKYAGPLRGAFLTAMHPYKERIFFDAIPEVYVKNVFPDRIYIKGKAIVEKPVFLDGKPFADAVQEFNASSNTAKLLELPLTQENLEVWLYLALSGSETARLGIAKDFCAWCRKNEPQKNIFLSAVMMGLFAVDGYSFDDEKGTYEPNERGNLLLDYIVEFPIPENATRLKIVRDGGNQTLVGDLMKKHGMAQAWQELLKHPVEPKFVEFKQHPREK